MAILLIEDGRLLRRATERALVKAGYDVVAAGDGENGLRAAREATPDLILLDLMLPTLSGLSLLQQLKRDPGTRHVPIIVLSGLSRMNKAKLEKEGAAAYLEKSEELFKDGSALLLQAIERVLARASTGEFVPSASKLASFAASSKP
jgi:two-component system response regulator RpaA